MIEREPSNKWQKLVKPIVESCKVAAAFDHDLVWTGEGADALGKLLQTMAKNLDEFNEISRKAMINQL